ncbi:MAG: HAD hydrolase family protein [Bacteroidales bacterium]|nr:HAD hydrolase family protein [Bacteroidales bacterium]
MEPNLKSIKAIAMDIDGVLTDGGLIPLANGDVLRITDAKDAFAVRFAAKQGMIMSIMSGGDTQALHTRMLSLRVKEEDLFLGCRGKLEVFRAFCTQHGLDASEVAYFGDDIADTQVLAACGCGFAPADAAQEAKDAADIVTTRPGGKGCVREGIEMILKAQGLWVFDPDKFNELY